MSQPPVRPTDPPEPRDPQTPAEIEADIERQREQLAATVDQLQTQVKASAVREAKVVGIAVGAGVAALVGLWLVRKLLR